MTPPVAASVLWYLARGTGAAALTALVASVVLGILAAARWAPAGAPRFVTPRLHRNLAVLVLVLVGVHVATIVLDRYVPLGFADAVVPFRGGYRALWVGLGTLALDLLLVLSLSSALRRRIGYRRWRLIHWASYVPLPLVVLHAAGSGTDARRLWLDALVAACLFVALVATLWRIDPTEPEDHDERPPPARGGRVVAPTGPAAAPAIPTRDNGR